MDSSLVSNKNVSEIFPSSGLGPGPNLSQTGQKPTPLMTSLTKTRNTKPKIFSVQLEDSPHLFRVWTTP